jgi:Flp pilus assembly protein TadG
MRCENGAVAVEFALVGLVMIVVTLGAIEFGRALYLRNNLSYAADRAARRGLIDRTATTVQLENEAKSVFAGSDPAQMTISIVPETVDGIPVRTISLDHRIKLLIPGLTTQEISMRVTRRIPAL